MTKISRPYGEWESPITPRFLANLRRLEEVQWAGSGDILLWLEGRSGQNTIVVQKEGDAPRDLFEGYTARGELAYGGGAFTAQGEWVVFVCRGRLYRQHVREGLPEPITPQFGSFAAPAISPDGQWVLFVHSYEDVDVIGVVDSHGALWPQRLVTGADFYAYPTWHPDGGHIAWIEWDHPNMPWDGTRLFVATVEGKPPQVVRRQLVAGDERTPVTQPAFSPDGRYLSYIVTEGEWDSLVLYDMHTGEKRPLLQGEGLVLTDPAWIQGVRTYGWAEGGRAVYVRRNERGIATLERVDVTTGRVTPLPIAPYTWIQQITPWPQGRKLTAIASSSRIPPRVVVWDGDTWHVRARSSSESIPATEFAEPQPISWRSSDGARVHGLYYPPTNTRFTATGLPPAIVNVHGGPTSQRVASFNPDAQFFTSRGWAYLEVNYRGSTGYGRSYMEALKGHWGEYDVEDAVAAARALAEQGLADPSRIVIKGGSAGGYTVLNALIRYPGVFKAGICLYGVSNLFTLAAETHKFESHYLDTLVGPLPEAAEKYRAWSPIFHAHRIRDPLLIFQGAEDKVVPPEQSESIVRALQANRVPHVYKLFPGEGHGWRKAETIEAYYQEMLSFLRQYVLYS